MLLRMCLLFLPRLLLLLPPLSNLDMLILPLLLLLLLLLHYATFELGPTEKESGQGAGSDRQAGPAARGRTRILRVLYPPTDVQAYAERDYEEAFSANKMGEMFFVMFP